MLPTAQCGRVRVWMSDAACGSLSESRRGEFEEHIGDCAACRAEFQRMENLLGKIDQSLRATLSVEPSPQLLSNVRHELAAQPRREASWIGKNRWLAPAGACAALAVLLIAVALHRGNQQQRSYALHPPVVNSARARVPAAPTSSAPESAKHIAPVNSSRRHARHPELALAHQVRPRNSSCHAKREMPEVIVQPGQMQAILQFVAEMQNGKINGAEIVRGIQEAQKPLQIKPLEIAPLDASANDSNETPAASSREPGSSNGRSE